MFSIDNYPLQDLWPDLCLSQIEPISSRALALMARNRDRTVLKTDFDRLLGAIEMMEGMEYHHDNFVRICGQLANGARLDRISLNHEAVAYVNRMGQFYAFATSKWVKKTFIRDPSSLIPTIGRLIVFRRKHAAHRSIDAPRPDDTEDLMWSHTLSLAGAFRHQWTLKPNRPAPCLAATDAAEADRALQQLYRDAYVGFQILDGKTLVDFYIERDHPTIIGDAYRLIEQVVLHE
jgi:hypothetical protein